MRLADGAAALHDGGGGRLRMGRLVPELKPG
jgi:hypothetical protein